MLLKPEETTNELDDKIQFRFQEYPVVLQVLNCSYW
jgi:hypothetical protein